MKSQREQILRDLQRGKRITPIKALKEYGCFRLAARISELRRQGVAIHTNLVDGPHGKVWAEYSLWQN